MTWAEALATFNFVVWLLPILIRSWLAWRKPNDSGIVLSDSEYNSVSNAISRLALRGKKIKFDNGTEADRGVQK